MKNWKIILGVIALMLMAGTSFSQKKGKYGATDEDSIKCVENLSLYIEFYKQKNYPDALIGWRSVFDDCPKSSKKMYANGARMYKYLSKKEKDPKKKFALVDTLLAIYDQRIENFGQKGFVLGQKGEALMQYRKKAVEEAYNTLKESVELEKNKSKAGPLTAYFQSSVKMLELEKITKDEVIETFGLISGYISYQLDKLKDPKYNKKRKYYETAEENIEILFGPIANCDDLIKQYGSSFEANKTNAEWLKRSTRMMDKKECTESPLFVKLAGTLHKLEPSAESAYNMGKMMVSKGQHTKAATYVKEAIALQTEDDKKADYYLYMANHYFRNLKQPAQARTYAQKAATARSGWGVPYLAIANYYAASAQKCGEGNEFKTGAIYWVAVDKCIKAKSVDRSVAEEANKKIATWSVYFPKKSEAFMQGFQEDGPYTVECWINETTKVRVQ